MPKKPTGKRSTSAGGSVRVHGKAGNGEGSVYPVAEGRWRATYRDASGKLRVVSGKTREQVIARRAEAMGSTENIAPSRFDRSMTVGELADWWLTNVSAPRVRASSLAKYSDRVDRIRAGIGDFAVVDLGPEQVQEWQAALQRDGLSSSTVADTRLTLRQVLGVAVLYGLVARNTTDAVRPPRVVTKPGRALTPDDARALITAAADDRLGAAVALLFVQGWRVSEVLGLAWGDIDPTAGTATIRRAAVYVDGEGTVLGPTKTDGAVGVHHLAPGVLALLESRREAQKEEQAIAAAWEQHTYDGRPIDLVFTTKSGGVLNRQAVTKALGKAARAAGLDARGLGTHVGRRTVVTTLYAEEGIDLADIARHVGHASASTTADYVRRLGDRPRATAEAAARRLDVFPAAGRREDGRT